MSEEGWQGRPKWAAVVRGFIAAIPILAGVAAAVLFSHLVNRPRDLTAAVPWWLASFAVSTVVMLLVGHQARRLLPLATLLKLSMAFPDRTPSRFALALRAGTIGNLKARLAQVREDGVEDEAHAAAETILVLAAAMNAHDKNTRGHAERVRAFTEMLGDELGLRPDQQERLRWASLLHDVGKVMVDPAILNKAGPLDEHEWSMIHRHPDEGARIAAPLQGWLGEWALAIEQHHEKYDGTGYPRQLSGEGISWAARIVAVADAFEVMTAPRPYKAAMSATAARHELTAGAGSHFDPSVVRAFLAINLGRLRWVMGPVAWVTQIPLVRAIGQAGSTALTAVGGAAVVAGTAAVGLAPAAPLPDPTPLVAAAPTSTAVLAPVGAPTTVAPTGRAAGGSAAPPSTLARAVATTAPPGTTRPNRPPVAADDHSATQVRPSKPVKIDLLANDSDPDGNLDPASTVILQGPSQGRANLNDGSVNYVPDNDASGGDAFTYRVCDTQGACDTATVTVAF